MAIIEKMNNVTIEKTNKYLIVKIPLQSVEEGRAKMSPRSQKVVDKAIDEGLMAIEKGKVSKSFKTGEEAVDFLQSLK